MESRGVESWIASLAASRARTSAQPEAASGLMELAADYGESSRGSLAKFDQATHSWRTAQCSLFGGLDEFSQTWPRWGLMHSGVVYLRQAKVPRISETESGLWPTPTVCGNHNRKGASKTSGDGLSTAVKRYLPTPQAFDSVKSGMRQSTAAVIARRKKGGCSNLAEYVTTPTADDTGHRKKPYAQGGQALSYQIGGELNPPWVEWLMGWPIGWTDLEPLATDRFQQWLDAHGSC